MPAIQGTAASTFNTTTGAHAATITPAVGEILVVVAAYTGGTVRGGAVSDDRGGTYSKLCSALKNTSADTLEIFVRDQLVTSAVLHTVTQADPPGSDTGGGLVVMRYSGMSGAGGTVFRQAAIQENGASAATPAPAFATAVLTGDAVVAAEFNTTNSTTSVTAPSGWTEQAEVAYTTPTTGLEVASRDSGFTGTTVTWGNAAPSAFCAAVVELLAGVATTIGAPVSIGSLTPAGTSSTTSVLTTTAAVPAGGKILLAIGWFSATGTLSSVTATGGLTGGIEIQQVNGSYHMALAYIDCPAGLASGSTVTATFSAGATSRYLQASYITGAATGGGYGDISGTQTATQWTSGNLTTNPAAGDLVFSGSYNGSGVSTPTHNDSFGFKEIADQNIATDTGMVSQYRFAAGGVAVAGQGYWTVSSPLINVAVAYAPAPTTSKVSSTLTLQYGITGRISSTRQFLYNLVGRIASTRTLQYTVVGRVSSTRTLQYAIAGALTTSHRAAIGSVSAANLVPQVNRPTGTVAGDLIVGIITAADQTSGMTCTPRDTGWTQAGTAQGTGGGGETMWVFTRIAAGGDPTSWLFDIAGTATVGYTTISVSLYDSAGAGTVNLGALHFLEDATAPLVSDTMTPEANNTLVLSAFGIDEATVQPTIAASSPAGLVKLGQTDLASTFLSTALFKEPMYTAASTSHTVTSTQSRGGMTVIFAAGAGISNVTRVSSTMTLQYGVTGRINSTRQLVYNVVGRISSTRQLKYNVVGRISSTRTIQYNLVGRINSTRTLQYGVTGRVNATRQLKYNVNVRVAGTRTLQYTVNARTSGTRTLQYTLIGRINSTRTIQYNVVGRINSTRTLQYSVVGRISSTRQLRYNVNARVTNTRTLQYTMIGRINATRQLRYNVNVRVAATRTLQYGIGGKVFATRTLMYNVQQKVTTTRTLQYTVTNRIPSTRTLQYVVIGRIFSTRQLRYGVGGKVASTRTLQYNVTGRVNSTRQLLYTVNTKVATTRQLLYTVIGRIVSTRQLRYGIAGKVAATRTIQYNVTGRVNSTRQLRYNINHTVSDTRQLRYDVIGRIVSSRILQYNVTGRIASSRTIQYVLRSRVSSQRTLRYSIGVERVTSTMTLRYHIKNFTTLPPIRTGRIQVDNEGRIAVPSSGRLINR